ncbi:MAG TPA: ABC transporter permease [Pseudonocardia sp.]|nr:ABC transporter permease [Pseudonocardia sp.]
MNVSEAAVLALRGLRSNKLRAVLTTLGIVIGVAAVIVLVGLGDGMKSGFNATFGKMATQITLTQNSSALGHTSRELTDADVKALKAGVPDAASITPAVTGSTTATYGTAKFQASIVGSTEDYLRVVDRQITNGQMFDAAQETSSARVVVLGVNSVTTLFNGDANAAIGKQIRIGRTSFTVIGVVASDMQGDDQMIMPLATARSYLVGGSTNVDQIIVKAVSTGAVNSAEIEIYSVLDDQHHITDPSARDYNLRAFAGQLENMQQQTTFMSMFIVAIAAISLVVGGIGVANIMLVSVTERTREIGIRKAIGAPRSSIMKQFLIEAVVVAGVGGVIGAISGVTLTLASAQVIPHIAPKFGTPVVSLPAMLVAFGFSLLIGLLAGGYPAMRAARLRPIEALRFQ